MAVCSAKRSDTNSSVFSLDKTIGSGRLLSDGSREREFNTHFRTYVNHGLGLKLSDWICFFRFMPEDAGGIMSLINSLMEQEHRHLVRDWKSVQGQKQQIERLVRNVEKFRVLCKDFRIQDREYDCSTSNFLVKKPRGLRINEHPFFMTGRMMRKLSVYPDNYSLVELSDKYEAPEKFLLDGGGHFDDTFKLGSTVVQVKSIENRHMLFGKSVEIVARSELKAVSARIVSCKSNLDLNCHPDPLPSNVEEEVTNFDPFIGNVAEIKLVGRVLSCLKQMSNYKDDQAQFGVIDNLYKVGCDNFVVAKSPTIHEILQMQPPNDDLVLVDLSKLSDVPLIFGTYFSTI